MRDSKKQGKRKPWKAVALSAVKYYLSKYLRLAEQQEIVITRHGKPVGLLIGFASEDEWIDYRLENGPRLLERIGRARQSPGAGRGVRPISDSPTD